MEASTSNLPSFHPSNHEECKEVSETCLFFLVFLVVFVGMEWLSLLRMMWQAQKLRQMLLNPRARQKRVKQFRRCAAELGIQDLLPKEDVVTETDSHSGHFEGAVN